MSFLFSPSAGTQIKIAINSAMTLIPGCEGVPEFGAEKGHYDTTSINDAAKSFGADLPDYGEATLTGIWDSADPAHAYLMASASNPAAIENFEVDFAKKQGGTTGAKATFAALVLSFKVSAAQKKAQMFKAKVKLTGAVTYTPAA